MADESPFDESPDDAVPGSDPSEGVRLIKPEQAAEAVERGDAVARKGDDRPKYGDRPEAPGGPRPNLRFPLADSADPTLVVRPKVSAVEPRADEPEGHGVGAADVEADVGADEPVLSLPTSGSVEMPHWTAPATGEVPKVIIGEGDDDPEEAARWSSFADQGPRWRDQQADWDDDDTGLSHLIEPAVDEAPLGALDTSASASATRSSSPSTISTFPSRLSPPPPPGARRPTPSGSRAIRRGRPAPPRRVGRRCRPRRCPPPGLAGGPDRHRAVAGPPARHPKGRRREGAT